MNKDNDSLNKVETDQKTCRYIRPGYSILW